MDYKCFVCDFIHVDLNGLIKHLKSEHKIKENKNQIKCVVNHKIPCTRFFFTFSGLRGHAKKCIEVCSHCDVVENVNEIKRDNNGDNDSGNFSASFPIPVEHKKGADIDNVDFRTYDNLADQFQYNFSINDAAGPPFTDVDSFTYEKTAKTKTYTAAKPFVEFLNNFNKSVANIQMREKDVNTILNLCADLVKHMKDLNLSLMDNQLSPEEALEVTSDLVCDKLSSFDSRYKRNKQIESNEIYVRPRLLAIGTRWEMKKTKSRQNGKIIYLPRVIQSTFQYVSIVDTIRALLKNNSFRDMYLEYNRNKDHVCKNGEYHDFCCTSTYQQSEFFQNNPNALQIQIASDDFEICNPLQSKANRHKVCGVYFTIRNMPKKFLSKLNNIYLICLCNADDLKTKQTDFNNIWRQVVKDITFLETVGIGISEETNIKGTLTQVAFDNLGANTALGFSSSFSATYYCRKCECTRAECEKLTSEDTSKYRSRVNYADQILTVAESEKVDLIQTKGVKYYCALSECNFFHIIDNPTVDVMHDINEGAIPFLIKNLIEYCLVKKVFSLNRIISLIKSHDYGYLKVRNAPSELHLKKRSLGQNASQSLCLFQSLPYILHDYRNNPALKAVWHCVTSLLRITEIVYSSEINEDDLKTLTKYITIHLDGTIQHFERGLIPKLLFLLHYPSVIRAVGPVVNMTMMRYESKHKVLKSFANNTKNFVNINKTMAVKHQKLICSNEFSYVDNLEFGKLKPLATEYVDKHELLIQTHIEIDLNNMFETNWMLYNTYQYRKGLFILRGNHFYEILDILYLDAQFYFLTKQWNFMRYDDFLNSFQIDVDITVSSHLIDFAMLTNKKPYQVKIVDGDKFIVGETLELRKIFSKFF